MNSISKLLYVSTLLFFIGCKNEVKKQEKNISGIPEKNISSTTNLKYAKGFEITDNGSYKVLKINTPWPKSEKSYTYALIPKENTATITLNKDEFDAIITIPIKKVIATSTTHIPSLELLEEENTIIGFPGTDYISSEKTRALIDNNKIRELGKTNGINTEVVLELQPDLIIGFGIDGNHKVLNNIAKAGIPVIFNGEWIEASPLAKAEWIKFFGVLYNKDKEASVIFNTIETNYNNAKKIAAKATNIPSILSGAMHKDVWYLPNGSSPEAQYLKDANTNYLWKDTKTEGSLALSFEAVFDKGAKADLWLSPGYKKNRKALEEANQHYTKFNAFKTKEVYSFANTTGKTGGVLYFELGTARPDLVLKDIIKICHPELLQDYQPHFFKKLE